MNRKGCSRNSCHADQTEFKRTNRKKKLKIYLTTANQEVVLKKQLKTKRKNENTVKTLTIKKQGTVSSGGELPSGASNMFICLMPSFTREKENIWRKS